MDVGFRYESEMTDFAAAAAPWWWPRGLQHDFVAAEIVGPDAVADLVARSEQASGPTDVELTPRR